MGLMSNAKDSMATKRLAYSCRSHHSWDVVNESSQVIYLCRGIWPTRDDGKQVYVLRQDVAQGRVVRQSLVVLGKRH